MHRRVLIPAALLAGLASGCEGGLVAVSGTVMLDGRPADDVSVSFQPADGQGPSAGGSAKEGRFEVAPVLTPGRYKVAVRAGLMSGRKIPAGPPQAARPPPDGPSLCPVHSGQPPRPVRLQRGGARVG